MLKAGSNIPQIDLSSSPKEESDSLWLLNGALKSIENYTKNFAADLHLFEYCYMQMSVMESRKSDAFASWCHVAARDAVMSIWHFRNEMSTANNLANTSPYVAPHLDRTKLGEAHSKFDQYFPEFAAIRHAVAHAGELAKNRRIFETHAFSGSHRGSGVEIENSKNIMIQDSLQGRTYTCTFEGRIVTCEISGTSLSRLNEITKAFYSGFTNPPATASTPKAEG